MGAQLEAGRAERIEAERMADLEELRVAELALLRRLWGIDSHALSEFAYRLERADRAVVLADPDDLRKKALAVLPPGKAEPYRPRDVARFRHRNEVFLAAIEAGVPREAISAVRQGDEDAHLPNLARFTNPYPLAWRVRRADGKRVYVYTPEDGRQVTRAGQIIGAFPSKSVHAHLVVLKDRRAWSAYVRDAVRTGARSVLVHAVVFEEAGEAVASLWSSTEEGLEREFLALRPNAAKTDAPKPFVGLVGLFVPQRLWVGSLHPGWLGAVAFLRQQALPDDQGLLLFARSRDEVLTWAKRLVGVRSHVFFADGEKRLYRLNADGTVSEG